MKIIPLIAVLTALSVPSTALAQDPPPDPNPPVDPCTVDPNACPPAPPAPPVIVSVETQAPPAPPAPDPCTQVPATVTINSGAVYSNDPNVTLTVTGCTPFTVANDGSFNPSAQFSQGVINWTLVDSGPERLPKVVYVRYPNGQVLTDDIILDTTPPQITSVQQVTTASAAAAKKGKVYRVGRLAVRVYDNGSGVKRVQSRRYGSHHYKVRATDKAGNHSPWKIVRKK